VARIGRKEPCPCGSGKKYKNCCLAKDREEEESERAGDPAQTHLDPNAAPSIERPAQPFLFGQSIEAPLEEAISPQDQAANERWERFEAAGRREDRILIFRETLLAGLLDQEEAFEMLLDLHESAETREEREEAAALIEEFRAKAPELYAKDFGTYAPWLIENALEQQHLSLIPELLQPFAQDPERFPDAFTEVIHLLMYRGYPELVLPVLRKAWPIIEQSTEIMGWAVDEYADILSGLTLFDYVESTPEPRPDDPVLLAALGEVGERDPERDRNNLLSLLGHEPDTLRPADFASKDKAALFGKLQWLTMSWLGDLHYRHGIPFGKGELARGALADYLAYRAEAGVRGSPLLLSKPQPLEKYVRERLFHTFYGTYRGRALLELLPLYVGYLSDRGLIKPDHTKQALREHGNVLLRNLESYVSDAATIQTIERAWQLQPAT
jgi:hypothetical protein